MISLKRAPVALALLLGACGTPTGGEGNMKALVFYDENENGVQDPSEVVTFPNAKVDVGTASGVTAAGGTVAISNVPDGMQTVSVDEATLPPYYLSGKPLTIQVPQETGNTFGIPVTLPIGTNTPNVYMAFGDSITVGDGSTGGTGYRGPLQKELQSYIGAATIIDQGVEATRSRAGAQRIAATFAGNACAPATPGGAPQPCPPAFVLIHYGTNDWNEAECRDTPPCYTINSLRKIVETVKNLNGYAFLATIIPVNVGYDDRVPPQRDVWVHNQDILIRQLATQEEVVLVDLEAAFLKAFADNGGNYQAFFTDHVHPSDLGYTVMVKTFYEAITKRATPTASAAALTLRRPGSGRLHNS